MVALLAVRAVGDLSIYEVNHEERLVATKVNLTKGETVRFRYDAIGGVLFIGLVTNDNQLFVQIGAGCETFDEEGGECFWYHVEVRRKTDFVSIGTASAKGVIEVTAKVAGSYRFTAGYFADDYGCNEWFVGSVYHIYCSDGTAGWSGSSSWGSETTRACFVSAVRVGAVRLSGLLPEGSELELYGNEGYVDTIAGPSTGVVAGTYYAARMHWGGYNSYTTVLGISDPPTAAITMKGISE
jgi:hypothetical protein